MGPKKKKAAAAAAPAEGNADDAATSLTLLSTYSAISRAIGQQPHPNVVEQLQMEGASKSQIVVQGEPPIGSGGIRALATAILLPPGAPGAPASAKPYTPLTSFRIWGGAIKDDGVASVAEILRLGGAEIQLAYLEILDAGVGLYGCRALGRALSNGANVSLLTLKLGCNMGIGSKGVEMLCKGLKFNAQLRQLHLEFCNVGPEGAQSLGQVLAQACTKLQLLNLKGNRISNEGIRRLSPGIAATKTLVDLDITDNAIGGHTTEEIEALGVFALAVKAAETLTTIKMPYNVLTDAGGQALLPAVKGNDNLNTFVVDAGLSDELYAALARSGGGKKKGKGKKKGGKKKK